MIVSEIKSQATWDGWLKNVPHTPFTQTWDWGVFQMAQGWKVWRLAVYAGDQKNPGEPVLLSQIAEVPIKFGLKFLQCAYGPIVIEKNTLEEAQETWTTFLKQLSRNRKILFLRAEPSLQLSPALKKVHDRQPSHTQLLDLHKSEAELLAEMHSKTRYNIKLAERKGVTVRFSRDLPAMDGFINCIKETYTRHSIKSFPETYYRTQLATIPWEQLAVAEHEGKIVAANLITAFGDTFTYVHGGSQAAHKDLMAPQLLQWKSIQKAKAEGYRWYDFYGIAPENSPNHPWAGITRFKLGFGGQSTERPGTFELPFKPLAYTLFTSAKRLRF